MSTGVTKTLEVIASVKDLAVRLIHVAKSPSIADFFMVMPAVLSDVSVMAADATLVVPELTGLNSAEEIQLGTAAYDLVKAVVAALGA